MAETLKGKLHRVGLSPGTLAIPEGSRPKKSEVSLFQFDQKNYEAHENLPLDVIIKLIDPKKISWLQVRGITDVDLLTAIGEEFNVHPLFLEDIITGQQRPKFEMYDNNLYFISYLLRFHNPPIRLDDEQIAIILSENTVITFAEIDNSIFQPIMQRISRERSRLRENGADYLCYSMLDLIIDHTFITLEQVDDFLTKFQSELSKKPSKASITHIQQAKKLISQLRNGIWPMREVISQFQRLDSSLISPNTKFYLHDVQDHLAQAMDIVENFKEITSSLFELHMATLNQKMNDVIKTLTIVATIFVPLTFITSLYGMNFKYMPELDWEWGYFAVLGFLGGTAVIMLAFFRRKNWI